MNGNLYRAARRFASRHAWACVLLIGLSPALATAQQEGWPRTLPLEQGLVTIYPLQAESMDGQVVRYRAALAYRPTPEADPVFGAGWFESRVEIDRTARLVRPLDLRLINSRFPEGTGDLHGPLAAAVATRSPGWGLDYSLDELDAALASAAAEQRSLQKLNTSPPHIVYRDHPALLVTLDGEPLLRPIEDTELQAVINTPYPLIFDGRHYYLNAMKDVWYRADAATGPFRFEARPPDAIAAIVKPDDAAAEAAAAEPITADNAPEVVVATRPTELIVTDGPALFVPLLDDLLVLQNSDDDVFMHVGSQQFYIVLAGRWYAADSLNGPWSYQPADALPAAFARIPPDSAQGDSRVYVAGTPEADEAVLDAQVPQAAAVERGPAEVEVSYDGEPDFRPVDGTDLQYAANTGAAVLQSDRRYYLVEDGVWYVADNPNGPWQVSAWRPQAVAQIPPTSPVYHVKYVYIYDYTPDVVYVGYTPGYLGSYVYHGTVVYGTGWYYRPWVSPYYYYPRPSTWGFHVGYSSFGGWSFGLSWNWGWGWGWSPYYASYWTGGYWHRPHRWHHRHYGYWGPRGYRPRPAHHGYHGHHRYAAQDRMPWRGDYRGHARDDYREGYRDGRADRPVEGYRGRHDNLYRDGGQRARVVEARGRPVAGVRNFEPDRPRVADPGRSGAYDRRSRTAPVPASELRLKAQIRDTNQAATRSLMVADSHGKVRRKVERPQRLDSTPEPGVVKTPKQAAPAQRPTRTDGAATARGNREAGTVRAPNAAARSAAPAPSGAGPAAASAPRMSPGNERSKGLPPSRAVEPARRPGARTESGVAARSRYEGPKPVMRIDQPADGRKPTAVSDAVRAPRAPRPEPRANTPKPPAPAVVPPVSRDAPAAMRSGRESVRPATPPSRPAAAAPPERERPRPRAARRSTGSESGSRVG